MKLCTDEEWHGVYSMWVDANIDRKLHFRDFFPPVDDQFESVNDSMETLRYRPDIWGIDDN